mgnify:CR=1 FL=1|jgi:hypothetical protein
MCRSLVTNTLKPCLLSGATVLITLRAVSAAHAAELAGVSFPDRATVRGRAAVLNGLGLRTATVLKVKVYVIGLYLENRSSDLQAIIASSDHKRIVMQFVRDGSAGKLRGGWTAAFRDNATDVTGIQHQMTQFNAGMRDVKAGDRIALELSGDTVDVLINDSNIDSISGTTFQQAVLSIWLGPEPPNAALRRGILGR